MTDRSRQSEQLRPGLWDTINERYPRSMVTKHDTVALAPLEKALSAARVGFVSSAGVQPKGAVPFDVVHPVGDYTFRRVPRDTSVADLEIHQIKYPTEGAVRDLNVIFPIERLRDLVTDGTIAGRTDDLFSFIGYNMDPDRFERTLAEELADAVAGEHPDVVLLAPAWPI